MTATGTPAGRSGARSRLVTVAYALLLAGCVAFPLSYWGHFAGDAEIHLVYGRNAADGHFFEFNRGETSPGVTSPGYMLLLGGLYGILPESAVPVAAKLLGGAAWLLCVHFGFRLARALLGPGPWAAAAGLVAGYVPGSVYNASVGMENGLFAALIVGWTVLAERWGWFRPAPGRGRTAALGLLLGLGCWLRPEGFVVAALALLWRMRAEKGEGTGRGMGRAIPAAAACAAAAAVLVAFHHGQTGHLLPTSGVARAAAGSLGPWHLGPIPVNLRVAERLGLYLPLTACFVLGTSLLIRGGGDVRRGAWGFAAALAWTFFLLYATVLGAAHLGRYLMFVMPFYVLVACLGARAAWQWAGRRGWTAARLGGAAAACAWLAAVFGAEAVARHRLGDSGELRAAVEAPRRRAAASETVLRLFGDPKQRPVVVAAQEVQIRYRLDERFVVRSLDGRTDPLLLRFVRGGNYDHPGYLKARGVDYLIDTTPLNRDRRRWSLDELRRLRPGGSVEHEGLHFTRLAWGYRVERL